MHISRGAESVDPYLRNGFVLIRFSAGHAENCSNTHTWLLDGIVCERTCARTCALVNAIRTALERLKEFLTEVNNIRLGIDFSPLKSKWANLASTFDELVRTVYDLRLSLEDHKRDVKDRAKKDGRKVKRCKEKVRAQYVNGGVCKALSFEVVAISNVYGASAGLFPDDEDFFAM